MLAVIEKEKGGKVSRRVTAPSGHSSNWRISTVSVSMQSKLCLVKIQHLCILTIILCRSFC
jgi:nicotinamide mononucleotide (NMN) deamidase PncC